MRDLITPFLAAGGVLGVEVGVGEFRVNRGGFVRVDKDVEEG